MTAPIYHDCYRCHGSGETPDGKGVCPVCNGARRFEIDPHEIAVEQYRESLSEEM